MAKQRFRNVKQGKALPTSKIQKEKSSDNNYASVGLKIKAFLTDAFMLVMPIMYVVFYLVMDGREDFAKHMLMGWVYILLPLVLVQSIFMYFTGQTPGYRAYNITLIDEHTKEKPTLFVILFRNLSAILSLFTLIGWALMFLEKTTKPYMTSCPPQRLCIKDDTSNKKLSLLLASYYFFTLLLWVCMSFLCQKYSSNLDTLLWK
ncbi:MAG: RDD family protein [Sulfurovum sp.]|nr:RDD family protein [Sulfurovum sp.]